MIRCFHCFEGEYKTLHSSLQKKWVIANVTKARGEWHITCVWREFLNSMSEERRERLMTRLAYSKEAP